ncbi:MAG: N-acetylmuramoyl-L-alanine amidase [bacterium]
MQNKKTTARLFRFTLIGLFLGSFAIMPNIRGAQGSSVQTQSGLVQVDSFASGQVSPEHQAPFAFNALGVRWIGNEDIDLSVRFLSEGDWSDWLPIVIDEDSQVKQSSISMPNYSPLIFTEPAQAFQYIINSELDSIQLVDFFYLDTIKDNAWYENMFGWLFPPAQSQDLEVVDREDWGADESLRFDSEGEELWLSEYVKPQVFIIHHTAGSNGEPSLDQAKAVIRGIYYYHAVIRGWGDIGYNYLIDTAGNIFEGRSGGDGVVGAHTYRGAECPSKGEEIGYNSGSIGVALLGNYENDDTLSSQSTAALSHLIAVKGRALGIEPDGESYFHDRTITNVFGHIDVDCTVCPGVDLHDELADIRTSASAEYDTLPDPSEDGSIGAEVSDQSDDQLSLLAGETVELWIDFENTGLATWRRYVQSPTLIALDSDTRSLHSTEWVDEITVASLTEANVETGELGRYNFTITAPTGCEQITAKFILRNGSDLDNTIVTIPITIVGHSYAGRLIESDWPEATLKGSNRTVTVAFENTGRETWRRDEISLVVVDEDGGRSAFITQTDSQPVEEVSLVESAVLPGETGHFTFILLSPNEIGRYSDQIMLVRSTVTLVGSTEKINSRVDSPSQAALVDQTMPVAMLNTWTAPVTVKFTNTGVTTWDRSVVLKIMNNDHGPSSFYDASWPGAVGEIIMTETSVGPDETATYHFKIKAPVVPGVYVQNIQLIDNDSQADVIQHPIFDPLIRVDNARAELDSDQYSAQASFKKIPTAVRSVWRLPVTVQYLNTGTATWDRNTQLNIYGALFRRPEFRDRSWSRETGGITINESSVAPGQTATFTFLIDAPSELQVYEILFQLSVNNERDIIANSYFSELIRVDS